MFLNIFPPGGWKFKVLSTVSKRDQGFDGVGVGDGVNMIRSKSPEKANGRCWLDSMKRSRTSIPILRMLRTAIRTIDSQSVHPAGELMMRGSRGRPFRS